MANGHKITDLKIVLQSSGGEWMELQGVITSYRTALSAGLDARHLVASVFPDIETITKAHALDLNGVIYEDGSNADRMITLDADNDVSLTYAVLHKGASRFGPYGKAVLGAVPLTADNGRFTLTNSNPGSGPLQFRTLHQYEAALATALTITNPLDTVLVNLSDKGTATAILIVFEVGATDYTATVDVTEENLSELTPTDSSGDPIPAGSVSADMTITTTPADAAFALDLGV